MLEQLLKDLKLAPSGEAFIDRVPVAVLARQEPPLRAATSNPQDGFEEPAHVTSSSEPDLWAGFQDGQNLLPLVIG